MTENNSKNNNWKESLKVETESNKSSTRKVDILFDPELYPELRHAGENTRTVLTTPNNDAYTKWHEEWVKDIYYKRSYIPPEKDISGEIFL